MRNLHSDLEISNFLSFEHFALSVHLTVFKFSTAHLKIITQRAAGFANAESLIRAQRQE